MNNLMDTYLNFTESKMKKYLKIIFNTNYDENIVNEFLRTYINARYYNIQNTDKLARAFYLRIIDELGYKEEILIRRYEEENEAVELEALEEKQFQFNLIHTIRSTFEYMLFFDNVRNVENFKSIGSIKEIIRKMLKNVNETFKIKKIKDVEEKLYEEVKSDILEKDLFLDKFDTEEFVLEFENSQIRQDVFYTELRHNVRMPMQYSDAVIEKVFTEGIIAEDKLQIEYILLSVVVIRDIINGDFKDSYIAEFATSLFKKSQKMNSILSLIENQALQEKISLNITYSDYIENQKSVIEYTKKGYNFVITLDGKARSVEDVERLKMFKVVIIPRSLALYREIKADRSLKNVVFK